MKKNKYFLYELQAYARTLASSLRVADVLCLVGDLGSGKTTFAASIINTLTGELNITSPTFNLVHHYSCDRIDVWHFDLYRIKTVVELYHLGIEETISNGITIIEWPQIAYPILPKKRITIEIDFADQTDCRYINITRG